MASLGNAKKLGQHFLKDKEALWQILLASSLNKKDLIIEIGPGKGILTRELCKAGGQVIAIELDPFLAKTLRPAVGPFSNLEVIHADALKIFHEPAFLHRLEESSLSLKVVSNIPYRITTPLLYTLIFSPLRFELLVLLLQKEVAEKLLAPPGSSKRTTLSVLSQLWAEILPIAEVPRTSFVPIPEVDGVILKFQPKKKFYKISSLRSFLRLLKIAFSGKRKKLINVLSAGYHLDKAALEEYFQKINLDTFSRAEDLKEEDWLLLHHFFEKLP